MSKQLAIAAAFSTFALSALALFAPGSADLAGTTRTSAASLTAPVVSMALPGIG